MIVLDSLKDINKYFSKLMFNGSACNYTYGLDVEFTNCPGSKQVINTIQIACNNKLEDVVIVFFPMDQNYYSPLKEELKATPNIMFNFLQSRKHIKVGVNIIDDISKIQNDFGIATLGYIDIQSLAISFNIHNASMNDLGKMFVKNFEEKAKPGGGYLSLDEKKIKYIAKDAINSLVIFYSMIGSTQPQGKAEIEIDEDTINFATEFFNRIHRVRFERFVNHMHSCYSTWCKYLTKEEARVLARELINILREREIINLIGGYFSANVSY